MAHKFTLFQTQKLTLPESDDRRLTTHSGFAHKKQAVRTGAGAECLQICDGCGMNPLPSVYILHMAESLRPTAQPFVTELRQEPSRHSTEKHCVEEQERCSTHFSIPKEPVLAITVKGTVRVPQGVWTSSPEKTPNTEHIPRTGTTNQSQLSSWHKMIYKPSWQGHIQDLF